MRNIKDFSVKVLSVIMSAGFLFSIAACNKETEESSSSIPTVAAQVSRTFNGTANISEAKPGDIIVFGKYEQDNVASNGEEDIEWLVLSNEDGKVLVISKEVLDWMRYSESTTVWEYSDIRTWLNNDFYNTAFTDSERNSIALTVIDNPGNPYYGTAAGAGTSDNIFCLSFDEARTYFAFNTWSDDSNSGYSQYLISAATAWAKGKKLASAYPVTEEYYNQVLVNYGYSTACVRLEGSDWWLRTNGSDGSHACVAGMYGSLSASECSAVTYVKGVRPAMYLEY